MDNNNLIHKHQYGFRKHHSTEYAALHIIDYLNYELDLKNTPINLFLDLSKAFDSLCHEILLSKLLHYGICDVAINLIKSYLENRKQYVQFDTCITHMKSIRNGVPQGSILGPLMFLYIYIQWWQKESGPSAILSKKEQTRVERPNKSRKTVIFVPEIQYV